MERQTIYIGLRDAVKFKSYDPFTSSLMEIKDGPDWLHIKKSFPIFNEDFSLDTDINVNREEFEKTCKLIKETWNIFKFIHFYFNHSFEKFVRSQVIPEFCRILEDTESNRFFEAVSFLYHHYLRSIVIVSDIFVLAGNEKIFVCLSNNAEGAVQTKFSGSLMRLLKSQHSEVIKACYKYDLLLSDSSFNKNVMCPVCRKESCVQCSELLKESSRQLRKMLVTKYILHQLFLDIAHEYMDEHILKICEEGLKKSCISDLDRWLHEVILNWMAKSCSLQNDEFGSETRKYHKERLSRHLYYSYTTQRINQIFKIIIEYPDSLPVLQDIKEWLPQTDLRDHLVKTLKSEIKTRLLHPGVNTSDILTAYIAAIRTMRVLDPSSQLLDAVTGPFHEYLKTRPNTIKCVVTSLTEEGPNDLAEELVSGEAIQPAEEEEDDWMNWVPPPRNPIPTETKTISKSADIITMLINVYGSKELFVNEYRSLLADRLLSKLTCNTETEIRNMELLKLRFGDAQLNFCEVMVKDIVDSKRINHRIRENPNYNQEENFVSAMIVSAQFWPPFKDERLELHPTVVKHMNEFTTGFETLKGNRTLLWKNHLGLVDLEIESGKKKLSLSVAPILANILLFFEQNREWSLKNLSKEMSVPVTILKRKISYWQNHGLISETDPDVYVLDEDDNAEASDVEAEVEDYEAESVMASTRDQRNEELQTFWSYIVGMLTNLESLSLERINGMLKMFVTSSVDYSLEELQNILDKKVREHELILVNGVYKLPK